MLCLLGSSVSCTPLSKDPIILPKQTLITQHSDAIREQLLHQGPRETRFKYIDVITIKGGSTHNI